MFYACWTVKGGSGTTVFATGLALTLAGKFKHATIVDLAGDVPAVLGIAEPSGRGVRDWLAGTDRTVDDLARLTIDATSSLKVIPAGTARTFDADALHDLVSALDGNVVVDLGVLQPTEELQAKIRTDWLVVRPCYLALRRASRLAVRPRGVVVVREDGRSLTKRDVSSVVGAPVIGEVSICGTVARSTDAGLLATRLPKRFAEEIEALL